MGMHTIDIVRRDAASQRLWFETSPADSDEDEVVTLSHQGSGTNTQVVYTIGMENDIVKSIAFAVNGIPKGSLAFSYLQDIQQVDDKFIEPDAAEYLQTQTQEPPAVLWLIHLAQGNLGE
jgi:hypothetical protein